MNSNLEKFIIELGFVDTAAIKGLKNFLKKVDAAEAKSNQKLSQGNRLLRTRTALQKKILEAEKAGLDEKKIDFFKRSAQSAKRIETLAKRRTELDAELTRHKQKQFDLNKKIVHQESKLNRSVLSKRDAFTSHVKAREKELERRFKHRQKVELNNAINNNAHVAAYEAELKHRQALKRKADKNALKEEARLAKQAQRAAFGVDSHVAARDAYIARKAAVERRLALRKKEREDADRATAKYSVSASFLRAKQDSTFSSQSQNLLAQYRRAYLRDDVKTLGMIQEKVRQVNLSISKQNQLLRKNNLLMKGTGDSAMHFARQMLSVYAIASGVNYIKNIGQDFQGMRSSMLMAAGTSKAAAAELKFVRDEVYRLGLDLKTTSDAYVKFSFAAKGMMTNQETRDLFVGFSEFATAQNIDKFRYEKGLTAIQQMLNKGQIMSEELKQQLAEQIPGAMKAFESALGVTSQELFAMMERGELMAKDVLPKVGAEFARLARNGGALEAALKNLRTQENRMRLGFQEGADTIFNGGFEEGAADVFAAISEMFNNGESALRSFGNVFKLIFKAIAGVIRVITPVIDGLVFVLGGLSDTIMKIFSTDFGKIAGSILIVSLAMTKLTKMTKAATMALTALLRRLLLIPMLILGIADEIYSLADDSRMSLIEKKLLGGKQAGDVQKSDMLGFMDYIPFARGVTVVVDGVKQRVTEYLDSNTVGTTISQHGS